MAVTGSSAVDWVRVTWLRVRVKRGAGPGVSGSWRSLEPAGRVRVIVVAPRVTVRSAGAVEIRGDVEGVGDGAVELDGRLMVGREDGAIRPVDGVVVKRGLVAGLVPGDEIGE